MMPAFADLGHRERDPLGVMGPVHPRQRFRRERLHAERDAIDPRRAPGAGGCGGDVVGIGLERNFGPSGDRAVDADTGKDTTDGGRIDVRRRPAAEVDGVDDRRSRSMPDGFATAAIPRPPPGQSRPWGRGVEPRSRSRSNCSAGRRRGRVRRRARGKCRQFALRSGFVRAPCLVARSVSTMF